MCQKNQWGSPVYTLHSTVGPQDIQLFLHKVRKGWSDWKEFASTFCEESTSVWLFVCVFILLVTCCLSHKGPPHYIMTYGHSKICYLWQSAFLINEWEGNKFLKKLCCWVGGSSSQFTLPTQVIKPNYIVYLAAPKWVSDSFSVIVESDGRGCNSIIKNFHTIFQLLSCHQIVWNRHQQCKLEGIFISWQKLNWFLITVNPC